MIRNKPRAPNAPPRSASSGASSSKAPTRAAEPKRKSKGKPKAFAGPATKFEAPKLGGHHKVTTDPAKIGNPPAGQPGLLKGFEKDEVVYKHLEGALKLGALSYDDLTQGEAGDCYFLSSAVAVAHDNPAALKQLFTENPDGTTTVHFFEKQKRGPARRVDITVDMDFPVGKDGVEYAQARDASQLWPEVLEKAYAKWKGGYENIGEGGEPKDALMALTGKASTYTPEIADVDPDKLWSQMRAATDEKRPMVAGTFDEEHAPGSYKDEDMVEGHDYTVLKAYESGGERLVDVRNPWGSQQWKGDLHPHDSDGNFTMKYADFLTRFEDFTAMNAPA
jgi:hypothetical protein